MTVLIRRAFTGRLMRPLFLIFATIVSLAFGAMLVWLVTSTREWAELQLDIGFLPTLISDPLKIPEVLADLGFSWLRIGIIVLAILAYVLLSMLMVAARARDIGIGGWGFALLALGIALVSFGGDPWIISLGYILAGILAFAPRDMVR